MVLAGWKVTRRQATSGEDTLDGFDLHFGSIREVHSKLASLISGEGIFVPTEDLPDHSAVVRFRVMLPDDFALIEGTGVVFWLRAVGEDPTLPAGIAVRFVTLGDRSRELIDKIVETNAKAGGAPFNVDTKDGQPPILKPGDQPVAPTAPPAPAKKVTLGMKKAEDRAAPVQLRLQVRGDDDGKGSAAPPPAPAVTSLPDGDPAATVWMPPSKDLEEARQEIQEPFKPEVGRGPSAGGPAAPQMPVVPPEPIPEVQAPVVAVSVAPVQVEPIADDPPLDLELELDTGPEEAAGAFPSFDDSAAAESAPEPTPPVAFEELEEVAAVPESPPEFGDESGLEWEDVGATEPDAVVEATPEEPTSDTGFSEKDTAEFEQSDWKTPGFDPGPSSDFEEISDDKSADWGGPPAVEQDPEPSAPEALEPASIEAEPVEPEPSHEAEQPGFWVEDEQQPEATPENKVIEGPVEPYQPPGQVDLPPGQVDLPVDVPMLDAEEVDLGAAFGRAEPASDAPTAPQSAFAAPAFAPSDNPPPALPPAAPVGSQDVPPEGPAMPEEAKEEFGHGFEFSLPQDDGSDAAVTEPEPDQEPTPQATPGSSAARKKGGGGVVKLLIAVVVLVVVSAGGYFGWDWYQTNMAGAEDGGGEAVIEPIDDGGDMPSGDDVAAVGPEPTAVPPTPVPVVVPSGPARVVSSVSFRNVAGGTEVVITADGAFDLQNVAVFPMDDPPRVLVRLRKIVQGYPDEEVVVGTGEISKIRIGHHPEQSPPALYVVLDLAGASLSVGDPIAEGNTVRVAISGG